MRNHTRNFHKKTKHYPHQKPAVAKCGVDQHWSRGILAITAVGRRNEASPHNRLLPPILALALNASGIFVMAACYRRVLISSYTEKLCKNMNGETNI